MTRDDAEREANRISLALGLPVTADEVLAADAEWAAVWAGRPPGPDDPARDEWVEEMAVHRGRPVDWDGVPE